MESQYEYNRDVIIRSRELLQNPYAYINGEGSYDAVINSLGLIQHGVYEARRKLQNQYAYLDEEGGYGERSYVDNSITQLIKLARSWKKHGRYSSTDIDGIVKKLQREMWISRSEIFAARDKIDPIEILNPSMALKCFGYSVQTEKALGQYSENGELFEVAGIIDRDNRQVRISMLFPPEIRNFTTAHELGHAVLHEGSGLHRDRALDGSPNNRPRNTEEKEADIFAAFFLLPEKQIRRVFKRIFLTEFFILNEDTAFALAFDDIDSVQRRCGSLRELTRILAGAEWYNGVPIRSLASQFRVSVEAMAIRLEELKLVSDYP